MIGFNDIITDPRGHRFMYAMFQNSIRAWAKQTTRYLRCIGERGESLVPYQFAELKKLHEDWETLLITDYIGLSTFKTVVKRGGEQVTLDNLESAYNEQRQEGGTLRYSPTMTIFIELSRTHYLIMHPSIVAESAKIATLSPQAAVAGNFTLLWTLERTEHFGDGYQHMSIDWKTPVMAFRQSDVVHCLLMMTEKLDQLPWSARGELEQVYRMVYTRNSVFFCDETTTDILDMPQMRTAGSTDPLVAPNVDYMVFCTIYFHAIRRRIFYSNVIKEAELPVLLPKNIVERVQKWFEDEVCSTFGSEEFEECYGKACEASYAFPGDLEWFKYRYPDVSPQTGPILECFRKELLKRYGTDYRVGKEAILAAVDLNSHSGHCARIFVVDAIDQYMRIRFNIPWRDGVVIKNDALEGKKDKLLRRGAPLMVQVFSRFMAYDNRRVYVTDSIYQAFAGWLALLRREYKSTLYGCPLGKLIKRLLG